MDMSINDPEPRPEPESHLHGRVTAAITEAFFIELAEVGYGKLTVDSIVKRAGVGKAAVYRRWPTKQVMAIALIRNVTAQSAAPPDTGSFEGDVLALTRELVALLAHPLVNRIIPAVAAEAARDLELERLLRDTVEGPRRSSYAELFTRAMERGEVPADCDVDLALDALIGPLYWRLLVRRAPLDADATVRLARGLVAATQTTRMNT